MNDTELLRQYAAHGSAEAFRELVARHTNLVYACARQRLHDDHAAQDVTQAAFLALAQQAQHLSLRASLSTWLYGVTRHLCRNHLRREQRRQEREMRAIADQPSTDPGPTHTVWEELEPHLAGALDALSGADREVVLLRFYRQASHRQIAEQLRISEDAAEKRVSRALEKLRGLFGKRGVTLSATALAGLLAANAAPAATVGLATGVASAALAGASGGTITWITTGGIAIMSAKLKIAAGAAVVCLLVGASWLALRESPATNHTNPPPANRANLGRPTEHAPRTSPTIPPSESPAATSTVTNRPLPNAADLYREAFAALEKLSKEELGLLDNWRTNAVAPELCAKLQPAVALAHQATTNCDWGVKFDGFSTLLPQLSQSRQLARALVWNAAHCRQEDAAGVGADLLAALRLGQNNSEFLVGHLVNTAIQGMALDYLAENARSLSAAQLAELADALSRDQYDTSFYEAMEWEAKLAEFEADRFAVSTNDVRVWQQAFGNDDGSSAKQLANLSKEQVVAKMREVAALEREYVAAIGLSEAAYQAWLTKLQTARQSNPFIDMMMPALDATVEKSRAAVVQRAMAVAGLQVLVSGPSVLPQYLDPATGQPFQYRPTSTGFELTSSFQYKDQPVRLNFRQ